MSLGMDRVCPRMKAVLGKSVRTLRGSDVRKSGDRHRRYMLSGCIYRTGSGDDTLPIMKTALAQPQIVTHNGKAVSVIIPIEAYQELLERVEDAADITWLQKARRKPLQYRPLDAYLADRRAARKAG